MNSILLSALVGAVSGVATNIIIRSIARAFQNWRFERMRICQACKGLRIIDGHIVHKGESIEINVPCPVCNPTGKFPRAKVPTSPAKG